MSSTEGCRTVILGAGLAGSIAALVCARAGHEVILVERDPVTVGVRPGAAHGEQLHNLLGRAQQHLRELVPGFDSAFQAKGGQSAAVASQTHVFELGVDMPERDLGLQIWSSRRSVVDDVVADAVMAADIARMSGTRAEGLLLAGDRTVGARVDGTPIEADLVIDAMGAKSPVTKWLPGPVAVDELEVRQWYTTMPVHRPLSHLDMPDFWLMFPTYPRTRGGLVSPIDGRTWNVSLSGGPADRPPRTATEFAEYARTLERPDVADLVGSGRPAGPPQTFRKPVASRRRFDLAPGLPSGLLSVGDAAADLNPLIGQGISVIAWQLACLATLLREQADLGRLTDQFRTQAATAAGAAWELTTLYESGVGEVTLTDDEYRRIVDAVTDNPIAHRRYVEIWHLLQPATQLRELAAGRVPAGVPTNPGGTAS